MALGKKRIASIKKKKKKPRKRNKMKWSVSFVNGNWVKMLTKPSRKYWCERSWIRGVSEFEKDEEQEENKMQKSDVLRNLVMTE